MIITPGNLRVHWVWPFKYNEKWCFSPKCVFSETDHHTALKLVPLPQKNLMHYVWLSKYMRRFSPKCVVFENLVPECTEFGPLTIKESDVLAQKVFFQKWIIIQLWNLYHCDHHTWKPQGEFGTTKESEFSPKGVFSEMDPTALNTIRPEKSDEFLTQNVFSQKQIIIQLWNLYHWDHHASKSQKTSEKCALKCVWHL